MKKFLSLVLAMIMALSLVTISAGAVSYEELTDKDEIPHDREEAVAVLNAISIIEGYGDGSYRPDAPLTRQVAAKFIVSLLIGPEAANNLTVPVAPYPDVPASSQFAAYISYCKTANIISGYSDGTFKPEGPLTGYAFAKMLLGALGYRGDLEGFTGSGWTMNVAKIGNAANLFNRLNFQGGETLNRADAAQLCLNTLKATMVEYSGGFNVTAGDATVVGAMTRTYVTSNQQYAKNIDSRRANQTGSTATDNSHWTVEFGEEHFKDLRMNDEHEGRAYDDFGRPSNWWSWKKVTIGVFPIEPDFVYTTQMAAYDDVKVTDAAKLRAMGLNGYKVNERDGTNYNINGKRVDNMVTKTADIANFTDNGTVVEVYVSEDNADVITDVVVVHTQLMQVKKIASEAVSLKLYKDEGASDQLVGFNNKEVGAKDDKFFKNENGDVIRYYRMDTKVEDVEVNDACYEFLSGLKADDIVAVIPVADDPDGANPNYEVAAAYKPETVTGALTGSVTFSNTNFDDAERSVTEVTVGGTAYKVATWNKDLNDINRDKLKVTKKDVTLYLDEFGNAMLATDVGSTSDYMILGSWKAAVVDGSIVRIASGWDIKGNAIELNVGSDKGEVVKAYDSWAKDTRGADKGNLRNDYIGFRPGDVLRYTNDGASGNADWVLSKVGVYKVPGNDSSVEGTEKYAIKSSNSTVKLEDKNADERAEYSIAALGTNNRPLVANNVKTIYVTFDSKSKDVEYVEVKDGLQNIAESELLKNNDFYNKRAEATLSKLKDSGATDASEVTAVVIKQESTDASLKNLGYIYDVKTLNEKDENGNVITQYRVFTQDGDDIVMKSANTIGNRRFVRFTELEDGLYRLREYERVQSGTSTVSGVIASTVTQKQAGDYFYKMTGEYTTVGKINGNKITRNQPNTAENDNTWAPYLQEKGEAGIFDDNNTDLTIGDRYANIISVRGARFLDLRNKPAKEIDSAKTLKEVVTGGGYDSAKKNYGSTVEVDIAFNDNPANDEFRLAYFVVVTAVKDNTKMPTFAGTEGGGGGGGDVEGIDTTDAVDKYGVDPISGGFKIKEPDTIGGTNYTIDVDLELQLPEWAAPANKGEVTVKFSILADGKKVTDGSNTEWTATNVDLDEDNVWTGSKTVTVSKTVADALDKATDKTIQITDVDYTAVYVKYLDDQNKDIAEGTGTRTEKIKTNGSDSISLANVVAATYPNAASGANYKVLNIVETTGKSGAFTNSGTVATDNTPTRENFVIVQITGLGTIPVSNKVNVIDKGKYGLFGSGLTLGTLFTDGAVKDSTAKLELSLFGSDANDCGTTDHDDNTAALTGGATTGISGAIDKGDTFTLAAKYTHDGTHGDAAWNVTYKITSADGAINETVTKSYTATVGSASATADASKIAVIKNIQSDITVEITAVATAKPTVTAGDFRGTDIAAEISFTVDALIKDADLLNASSFDGESANVIDTNPGGVTVTPDKEAGKTTITLKLTTAANGKKVTFKAGIVTEQGISLTGYGVTVAVTSNNVTGLTAVNP